MDSVSLPPESPRRQLARRLVDAGVSLIPVAGPFANALYSVTHPEETERLHRAWQETITGSVNELIEIVAPAIKLTGQAIEVAEYLCRQSEFGLARRGYVEQAEIQAALPHLSADEVRDACGELELDKFVVSYRTLNGPARVSPSERLFWVFDPIVFPETDPNDDAKSLAEIALKVGRLDSHKVITDLGWPLRWFNPPMTLLMEMLGSNAIISKTMDPEVVTRQINLLDAGRAILRRAFNI